MENEIFFILNGRLLVFCSGFIWSLTSRHFQCFTANMTKSENTDSFKISNIRLYLRKHLFHLYFSIHADIRSTVYCVGVQAGDAREWQFAWERFLVASAPSERELLLSVLGCTRAPYLLYRSVNSTPLSYPISHYL